MTAVLSINDNNLLIQQGGVTARSQGFAWMKQGDVFFDLSELNNAVHSCRLEPGQINSHYWQQCEQTAIAANEAGMRHAADLVWRHLTELKREYALDDVILVVPSHYQSANLQLLLGIAEAVGITVSGLINKAVLELHPHLDQTGSYLHVDMQLHQTVCSEVIVEHGEARLGNVEVLHDVGLQAMQDALLKAIQNRFILGDRFDPLHYAETEQQLFDRLPELATLIGRDGKANVTVSHEQRTHATSIDGRQWLSALQRPLELLMELDMGIEFVHKFVNWNGFPATDTIGPDSASLDYVLSDAQRLQTVVVRGDDGGLIYQTSLATGNIKPTAKSQDSAGSEIAEASVASPVIDPDTAAMPDKADKADSGLATHLLQGGVAVPIDRANISLDQAVLGLQFSEHSNVGELLADHSLFVMGDQARIELQPNDRLGSNLADGVITVIRVIDGSEKT